MKTGTRIMVSRLDFATAKWVYDQPAKIGRWHKSWKGLDKPEGYYPVTFDDDGGKLMIHESSFRVIDNRF